MIKVKIYNQEGNEVGEQELNPAIFEVGVKPELVHQAVLTQMANKRLILAHTKDRGDVSGGGKKPWKQKGTGRARHGSIRSPLWRHGGVTFGPTKDRNFCLKINKKARRKALLMCLSDKAANDRLIVLDKLELPEVKTRKMKEILLKLPAQKSKTLIALAANDKNILRSSLNIPHLQTILADSLNVVDILNYKYLMVTVDGLKKIEDVYLG